MDSNEKLVLIDSNAIIHRAYHALPQSMRNSKGELTNSVYGYTTTLIKVLEDLKPTYIAASFDISKATFRHETYSEYKATRVVADQALYDQIPKVRQLLKALNIPVYQKEGYEADDVIGTIVNKIRSTKHGIRNKSEIQNNKNNKTIEQSSNMAIYIVTGDKDLFQLLNGEVFVYWLKKGLSQSDIVDKKKIKEEFNLDPEDFIDLKALAGDSSDNIPGVPGIGPKTATDLLIKFDTLKNIYKNIEDVIPTGAEESFKKISRQARDDNTKEVEPIVDEIAAKLDIKPRIIRLLLENRDQAFMSKELATIECKVPIEFDLEDCRWGDYDREELKKFFEEMQFHSLLRRFNPNEEREIKTKKALEQKKKDEQLKLL